MKTSPEELKSKLDSENKPLVLDVRTPAEHQEMRVPNSELMPLGELDPEKVKSMATDAGSCVVVCQSGKRSQQAAEKLKQAGFDKVTSLEGGLEAWDKKDFPLERSAGNRLPIMRQVQLVAGSFVLVGTILTVTVDPWWAVVPGFFGAGLTFAGLSGHCGMALMLAKMPWNRVDDKSCSR